MDARIKRLIVGKRAEEWTRIVLSELGLQSRAAPEDLERAWEANLKALLPLAEPLPGAERVTAHLAACGVPQGLVTSSSRAGVAAKASRHAALFARFRITVAGGDVARGKPFPDPYLAAAKLLGVPPEACLAFEDAEAGVLSATAAGMAVVAVPDGLLFPGEREHKSLFQGAAQVLPSLDAFEPELFGLPACVPR